MAGDQSLEELAGALGDSNLLVRRTAARLLADMGQPAAPQLQAALDNADMLVRRAALLGLCRLDPDQALSAAAQALDAVIPIRLDILDPVGHHAEYSGWYGAGTGASGRGRRRGRHWLLRCQPALPRSSCRGRSPGVCAAAELKLRSSTRRRGSRVEPAVITKETRNAPWNAP